MQLKQALLIVSGALVLPSALAAIGTFFPAIPYVGTLGSYVLPPLAPHFALVALLGSALAFAARRLGARRLAALIALIGLFTAVAAATVLARHVRVAARNGARVDVLSSFLLPTSDVGATPDVTAAFTRVDGDDLELDIYKPQNGSSPAPVLIYIHGGGWTWGARTAQSRALRWFADRGYVVVSPDYALATPQRPTWNTAAAQVTCAMTWIAKNAAAYGGDPHRLFAFGESAGGALALTMTYAAAAGAGHSSCGGSVPIARAVAAQYPAVDPVTFYQNRDPLLRDSARQMVSLYLGGSPAEYPDRARFVSSVTYVTAKGPPTLLLLSDSDHLVPIAGALHLADRATQSGASMRVVRFPWADHTINLQHYSVANQAMLQIMLQHFCRHGGVCPP